MRARRALGRGARDRAAGRAPWPGNPVVRRLDRVRSRRPRALLLEGENALRHALTDALDELGFDVLASEDRKAALAELLRHPDVELAVVDLVDAAADGEAVVSFLRDVPETASVPLIVMTDGAWAAAPSRAVRLAKPFGLDQLISAVRSCERDPHRPDRPDPDAPRHP